MWLYKLHFTELVLAACVHCYVPSFLQCVQLMKLVSNCEWIQKMVHFAVKIHFELVTLEEAIYNHYV